MISLAVLLALVSPLHSCEEIATLGCQRSRVVMLNEAHDGLLRMVRARRLGRALLPTFWAGGVRVLAAEALTPQVAEEANRTRRFPVLAPEVGYQGQPEMREFFQAALDQGMDLAAYEVSADEFRARQSWLDPSRTPIDFDRIASGEEWNRFRELNEAEHLVAILRRLNPDKKMLVWCGNGHLSKQPVSVDIEGWSSRPYFTMACYFRDLSGVEPFCIDQTATAEWPQGGVRARGLSLLQRFGPHLSGPEQSAGLLVNDLPAEEQTTGVDAFFLSQRNKFE